MMANIRPPLPHAAIWRLNARPVVAAAAKIWGFPYEALMGPRRHAPLPEARFAAMLVLKRMGWSYPTIAMGLGRGDHSTAIHGVRRAAEIEMADPGFAVAVAAVERAITKENDNG